MQNTSNTETEKLNLTNELSKAENDYQEINKQLKKMLTKLRY